MDWPSGPIEIQRRFVPRFCPRRSCPEHRRRSSGRPLRYRLHSRYTGHGGRVVQRYRCLTCRHTFSRQSFACSYYLKRPELLQPVAAGLSAGSAHRQLARSLGCAPSTVTRLAARLGRHALLLQAHALEQLEAPPEPTVIDHFETFEGSQDFPFGVATAVGARSWFVYALDPAPHRRAGRRSTHQQARVDRRPARPHRGGYAGSFKRTLDLLQAIPALQDKPIRIVTDGHSSYRRELRRRGTAGIRHSAFPNPERGPRGAPRPALARVRDAAMFPNDLLHLLLRHSLAHHRRETLAFGRRLNALMERLFLAAAWRNFVKDRSERRPQGVTPAMTLGLTDRPWSWARVLARRLFPDRQRVCETWMQLYRREWTTPTLRSNTRHSLARAF
jgi:transposase-like protein